ncbi:hypothetical protein CEN39_20770 [Fischerella thermalis CCMEE 5201]|nr:hypothetical protein CEN39_20770 [Fischerella thermalis CCMEE 5201]
MNRPATRSLSKQFRFEQPKLPSVVVNFNGGLVTSDAGLNLIAEIDRKLQITSQFAQCFQDYRQLNRIDHSIENLIRQRIYGLVMGYEDSIRTKLLKLGALITVSTRRILIAITSSCPYKHIFATVHRRLKILPNTA